MVPSTYIAERSGQPPMNGFVPVRCAGPWSCEGCRGATVRKNIGCLDLMQVFTHTLARHYVRWY